MKKKMSGLLIMLLLCLIPMSLVAYEERTEAKETEVAPVQPAEDGWYYMEATAYCYGDVRCDGGKPRPGVCAGPKAWYGMTAGVVEILPDGTEEFLGYYEVLDTGGPSIKTGKVLDIWMDDYDQAIEFGRKNVKVKLFKGVG